MTRWNDRRGRRFCADVLKAIDPSYRVVWRMVQPVQYRRNRRTPTWPGDGRLVMGERDLVHALHDLAHALLASKSRRRLPEFGLGPDPANMQEVERVVSETEARREEIETCDLHWCLAAYLEGYDGALAVEGYVDTDPPLVRVVQSFSTRLARALPADFGSVVLDVRHERLAELAELRRARASLTV